jgi:hypothetical protein
MATLSIKLQVPEPASALLAMLAAGGRIRRRR